MSKEAFWFRHDSNAKDDPKCVLLIDQLGLEGYGIYWVLVELLRGCPELSCPVDFIQNIADKYQYDPDKIRTVIHDYGLFEISDDKFFSPALVRRVRKRRTLGINKTIIKNLIRSSRDYSLWRKFVFERDDYTCRICGQRGGKLEAHHIKSFARFPESRLDVNNGITLCKDCHKQWHKEHGK